MNVYNARVYCDFSVAGETFAKVRMDSMRTVYRLPFSAAPSGGEVYIYEFAKPDIEWE